MEILTVSEINPNSLFLGPNSPSREKSPQSKLNSKHLSKISSNLQYVPKKPSSPGVSVEPKSDSSNSVISNTSNTPSTTATQTANTASSKTTKLGKTKKIPKKTAALAPKKVSTQTSTPSKAPSAQNNNQQVMNNSPKKAPRAPLSTIYDSTSNTPKRAEYRPVSKKNSTTTLEKPEENTLKKLEKLPTVTSPKSKPLETISASVIELDPLLALPVLVSTPLPNTLPLQVTDEGSLKSVQQTPKQLKVYSKNQLLAIGRLPICSIPHSGKSPSEIIEEYNLQYAQQEKEIAKFQEEENILFKQPNHNLHSSYPNLSRSYDTSYSTLTHSVNFGYGGNINPLRSSFGDLPYNSINQSLNNSVFQSPSSKNNKKAWIPRKSADSIDTSSPETLSSSLQADQPRTISQNKVSMTNQNPHKPFNYYNNDLQTSQHQVVYSTEYNEADQNECSDEESEPDNSLQYSGLQEISPKRLESRQKQIDIGKNTPGYKNYFQLIKKEKRKYYDPHTPDKYQICSKRSWDGQIRVWRRLLHLYDSKKSETENEIKKE